MDAVLLLIFLMGLDEGFFANLQAFLQGLRKRRCFLLVICGRYVAVKCKNGVVSWGYFGFENFPVFQNISVEIFLGG
jgi:hypothetical protein